MIHAKRKIIVRLLKTKKSCDHFYKGIYFTIVTIWGYIVMKDTVFLPPCLLGSGDLSLVFENYPEIKMPYGLRGWFLGSIGYYLHILIQ